MEGEDVPDSEEEVLCMAEEEDAKEASQAVETEMCEETTASVTKVLEEGETGEGT